MSKRDRRLARMQSAIFARAEHMAGQVAHDLAECRRGLEDCRNRDTALRTAYATRLGDLLEDMDQ